MNELEQKEIRKRTIMPFLIVAIICAWIIGMSILGAGYLISKEFAKQSSVNNITNNAAQASTAPVNINVPAGENVLGDNHAKVTIVEFADFQCPFCGEWQKEVFPELKKQYIDTGKVRFVYMDYAFLGQESVQAAEAARCAADQNRFWEYHDKLFASQNGENEGAFSDSNLKKFAHDLSLNTDIFNSCLDTHMHSSEVGESSNNGNSHGVNSTPTIFIDGIKSEGVAPFQSYQQIIETELAKK